MFFILDDEHKFEIFHLIDIDKSFAAALISTQIRIAKLSFQNPYKQYK